MVNDENIFFTNHLEELPLRDHFPVIWLASWYPSSTYPTNGDFIQRHALSLDKPVLVVHTVHDANLRHRTRYALIQREKITEIILYFRQPAEGGSLLNRLLYHWRYLSYTKELLRFLFRQCGRPSLLHVHVPMKMGLVALWAKKRWGIPFMVSEQSSKYVGNGPDHFSRRSSRHKRSVATIFQQASVVTNVSGTVGNVLARLFHLDQVNVVYNVADTSVFYFRPRPAGHPFRFIHVSTLTPQKNIDGILRVCQKVYQDRQDFTLQLVGGEPGLPFARANENWPWLEHTGWLPHDQVAGQMQDANALLMFSEDENFPCVIAEALCCGLPVITSVAGGSAEVIHEGNGIAVPVGDEPALEKAIHQLLDHQHEFNGNDISTESAGIFGKAAIAQKFLDLYRSVGVKI